MQFGDGVSKTIQKCQRCKKRTERNNNRIFPKPTEGHKYPGTKKKVDMVNSHILFNQVFHNVFLINDKTLKT